jgi:iron complex outermembrane receptor protein
VQRSNTNTDYLICHAFLGLTGWSSCPEGTQAVPVVRSGSENLKPEESENLTAGIVLEATFLPVEWGELSLTADWWRIEQSNVISVFGEANHLALDYALRMQDPTNPNAGNPNVIRGEVSALTPDELQAFQDSGIAPAGRVARVLDTYFNQDRAETEGVDIGLYYRLDDTAFGDFSFRLNAANLYNAYGEISTPGELINAAAEAGIINPNVTVGGAQGQQVRRGGRPKWRYTSSLSWSKDAWSAGWFTSHVGSVLETGLQQAGQAYVIDSYQTHNLYVDHTIGYDTDQPTRVRLGLRNVFDEEPPLADTNFGYLGELHSPAGRFLYASIRKEF